MASIQERQTQRRLYVDAWSVREKLCLASAVLKSGDQNWNAVSRTIKPNADPNRPLDWMVPKACAIQYQILLDSVETPKRKKRVAGEKLVETAETSAEYLVRKLTQDHQEDLKRRMEIDKKEYYKVKAEIEAVETGNLPEEELDKLVAEMDLEEENKRVKEEEYKRFLVERDQKKRDYERPLWKSPSVTAAQSAASIKSNLIDKHNESTSNVEMAEAKPSSAPTSPLLTSLLQSPSPLQRSSALSATPTISNLLNSAPAVPHYSTESPTLTKLLESRSSPRSTASSLVENVGNKTDLPPKQLISTPPIINNQSSDSSRLTSPARMNKSPITRTPSRSDILNASLPAESNPDISSVVRCLYMEDVDKKACVGIETTQLLLNQANVDLSKVDEQKLQDEIVDMIVEQQETDGMNIVNLQQQSLKNSALSTTSDMPTVVKIEMSQSNQPALQMSLGNSVEDSNIVVLNQELPGSISDNSNVEAEVTANQKSIDEIKEEPEISFEIEPSHTALNSGKISVSESNNDLETETQSTVVDFEATESVSLNQAEISIVGMSPIKSETTVNESMPEVLSIEPAIHEAPKKSIPSTSVSSASTTAIESALSMNVEKPSDRALKCTEESSDGTDSSLKASSQFPLKEALIKIGRVDEVKEASIKVENENEVNFNQNVIILDTNIDLNTSNIPSDIIIDNDTEVIIAKDDSTKCSIKPNQTKLISDDTEVEVACTDTKAENERIIPNETVAKGTKTSESGVKSESVKKSTKVESDSLTVKETTSETVAKIEESSKENDSKSDTERKLPKSDNKKLKSSDKVCSEEVAPTQSKKVCDINEKSTNKVSVKKEETPKKTIEEDEDEDNNDGDDEDDSDEQVLSSLKKSGISHDKKQPATRKKSTLTPVSSIPPVSDFVDTSSDTHSTGGDDSESTSTSVSATPRSTKKTSSREKKDSVSFTSSSTVSSQQNLSEEKELRQWKKSIMMVYGRIATHKYASLFLKHITEDRAPGYHNIVKQPIDLLSIKKNIENGTLRTTLDFQRAIMLMFTNALFFNWRGSEVYKMTNEMMMDTLAHIQLIVQTMGEGMPYAQSETETPEKQARTERTKRSVLTPTAPNSQTPSGNKRKRSGIESSTPSSVSGPEQSVTPVAKRRRCTSFNFDGIRDIKVYLDN